MRLPFTLSLYIGKQFLIAIAIAFAGACALGIAMLWAAAGREWLLLAVAGVALLALSRLVRWRANRALPPKPRSV